jgi:hypothetical protein
MLIPDPVSGFFFILDHKKAPDPGSWFATLVETGKRNVVFDSK